MDTRSVGGALVFGLLVAFSIPWFLWGSSHLVAGLPLWLWWHIAWMGVAALVFRTFARHGWGLWVTDEPTAGTSIDGARDRSR